MVALIALECAARHPDRVANIALLATAYPMTGSDELLDATRTREPVAQETVNIWSHSAYAHDPNNPGPGSWSIRKNPRLTQPHKPGVMHVQFAACNAYANGMPATARVNSPAVFLWRDAMP